ncbi:MAG: PAS domain-containing sensor histidine kinase [Planctomycetota bacterium]
MQAPISAAEQRYCLLFQQSLAGIYRTTTDGRMLDCNDAMAAMLGYESRAELLSRRASDLYFSQSDRRQFLRRLRETGKLVNSECRLKRKDGTTIFVLENVSLLPDDRGKLMVIQGNMVDITERRHMEEALRNSEQAHRNLVEELRRLTDRLNAVREDERTCIARELHDEFGQTLTALNMDLHWLTKRSWRDAEKTCARLDAMVGLVGKTMDTLRRICADLRPTILDDFGLIAAIEWQAREFERHSRIRCRTSLPVRTTRLLPKEQTTAVFRILQESLTNVARHAHASNVIVKLAIQRDVLILSVQDDGKGIGRRQMTDARSLGLLGMRERVLPWGGRLDIVGVRQKGTTVTLRIPVVPSTEDHVA